MSPVWPIATLLACWGQPFPSSHPCPVVIVEVTYQQICKLSTLYLCREQIPPATWRSAFCLPVTQPAHPIPCRHGSSFSCHLHRKTTDKQSVSGWGQLMRSCLLHSAPSPLLSLGPEYCLSSVEGHCLERKGNCAACHLALVLWGCALCIVHLQNTSVLLLANSWSGNIKYCRLFSPSSQPVVS